MATETALPKMVDYTPFTHTLTRRAPPPIREVLTTVYSFPEMEPLRFAHYPANHLHVPLRRDILHRAVIFEADATRQGTASTKWRDDVRGSFRKIRPQKGSGRARLGDKKSPMLRGGGVAFGPHPRDFSTKLPRKIYDLAWRTALSYRYRRGQLIIVQKITDLETTNSSLLEEIMQWNHWDRRSMIVTRKTPSNLFQALNTAENGRGGWLGSAKSEADVDVKDLLSMGRVVIEKRALDSILKEHSSDLDRSVPMATYE